MHEFVYRHDTDGELTLRRIGDEVRLRCRWPFDLSSDEWIELSNRFVAANYDRGLIDLKRTGHAKLDGITGGGLQFHVLQDGFVDIVAIDAQTTAATRFITRLDVRIDALELR